MNGFKISQQTVYGCTDGKKPMTPFSGYGSQVRAAGSNLAKIDQDMAISFQLALDVIWFIWEVAHEGKLEILSPSALQRYV